MKIVLIGAGNVATILGKLFYNKGFNILQVVGRSMNSTVALAYELNANAVTDINKIDTTANLYVIAVPDDAVKLIASQLILPGKLVVHTAGTLPCNFIESISKRVGVVWPLQSLRKEIKKMPVIPFVVDGNSEEVTSQLVSIMANISDEVTTLGDDARKKLHLSAVIVSNFTNHLYALTQDYCTKNNLPYEMLKPLIEETALRLQDYEAKDIQTGPSVRGDKNTVKLHEELLKEEGYLHLIYSLMDDSIGKLHKESKK